MWALICLSFNKNMKAPFSLATLALSFLLDMGMSKKHWIGPCLLVLPPEPCPDPDIEVYLFTRKNTEQGQIIKFFNPSYNNLASTNYNLENPTKMIIHGFNTDMNLDVLQDIKTEYLKYADLNVLMVNYPRLVHSGWCYWSALINIRHVGACLAQLVELLRWQSNNPIHVIGFSLGGQVPNFIAHHLPGKKLDRITGLDPAGPGFEFLGKSQRLDKSDAKFVDVIHTNGGIQGDIERCGDIDFYVNGGVSQPGCYKKIKDYLNCNHRRAPQYFAESINTKVGFLGWKCGGLMDYILGECEPNDERVVMGEQCPIGSSGFYIVKTAAQKPFALENNTIAGRSYAQDKINNEVMKIYKRLRYNPTNMHDEFLPYNPSNVDNKLLVEHIPYNPKNMHDDPQYISYIPMNTYG